MKTLAAVRSSPYYTTFLDRRALTALEALVEPILLWPTDPGTFLTSVTFPQEALSASYHGRAMAKGWITPGVILRDDFGTPAFALTAFGMECVLKGDYVSRAVSEVGADRE